MGILARPGPLPREPRCMPSRTPHSSISPRSGPDPPHPSVSTPPNPACAGKCQHLGVPAGVSSCCFLF